MIISFNPDVFTTGDDKTNSALADIFKIMLSDRYLVDVESIYDLFFNEEGIYIFNESPFAKEHLATTIKGKLEDFIFELLKKNAYLTELHIKYLTQFKIGTLIDEMHPLEALIILNKPSLIILENGVNDWKFIESISQKYRNHSTRKSIYRLINKSIENKWLEGDHAGGKGQIKARIEYHQSKYSKEILKYKIAALFDSDRDSPEELEHQIKLLVEWIKGKTIVSPEEAKYEDNDCLYWHMLYKREVENYIPVDIIINKISDLFNCDELIKMSVIELDYLKYEDYLNKVAIDVKNEFPKYFIEDFTRDRFETRCGPYRVKISLPNGTLEQVSEIESILLKIARII